jgi:hypothetical protein
MAPADVNVAGLEVVGFGAIATLVLGTFELRLARALR